MSQFVSPTRLLCCLLLFSFLVSSKSSHAGMAIKGTYVLHPSQVPNGLKKFKAGNIYIIYSGQNIKTEWRSAYMRGDTIINLKDFIDSTKGTLSYRLLFE